MRKKFGLTGLVVLIVLLTQAQTTVQGKLQDQESGRPVQAVTVLLRSAKDTSSVQTTFTDSTGKFVFRNLSIDSFLLKFSSVGFENLQRSFRIDSTDSLIKDLGIIILPKTSKELGGVTVTATAPPAQQKGDTLQFNASQFKTNPDASAEDLARKVPGITVENGEVKAQGETVRRVTLDGRELFGDDATAALRNLPAEVVDKIQVFDRLTDQAQASGFSNGETQKEINIVTKANMRNGQFGRVYAGYGTEGRYQAGGNTTILKENRRISLVGLINNINQQNFASQDLLGVTNNTGGGQRGGGGGNFRGGGGGGPRGGGGNRGGNGGSGGGFGGNFGSGNFLVGQQNGINRTNAFGINYSDNWGKKIRVSGSYFFNNSENNTNQLSNTQYFLKTIANIDQRTLSTSNNDNHRVNMRLEYNIDSSNRIILTPNISFQNNSSISNRNSVSYYAPFDTVNTTDNRTTSDRNGYNINNNLLYSHNFKKRGRTFSVNINTSYNKRDGETYLELLRSVYTNSIPADTTERRFTDQYNNSLQLGANVSYTEPVGKNAQVQLSYNPSYQKGKSEQEVYDFDPVQNKYGFFNDSLTNVFNNVVKAQNGGLAYRYGTRDNQLSFGVNYQQTELSNDRDYPTPMTIEKSFKNFLPNAQMRFKLSPRSNIRLFYRTFTNAPSVTQLQDVIDITNRPFLSAGNPDLKQQYNHTVSANYTFTNTSKGTLFVANVFAQRMNDYITNATFIANRDSLIGNGQTLYAGEQLTKPINLDGYLNLRSFLTFAVPLKFIKSNLNMNGGVSYSILPGQVNYQENESKSYTYSLGTVLSSNISQYIDFTLSYTANFSTVNNNTAPELNNDYFSHVAGAQLNLLSKQGWFFQNDLTNQLYKGLTAGFNQNFLLWNMGVGKKFLKDRKGELKLSVFDLLKQNRSITRNVTEAYVQDVRNDVLTQYFMLTFTYNLRNFGTAASRAGNNPQRNRMSTGF